MNKAMRTTLLFIAKKKCIKRFSKVKKRRFATKNALTLKIKSIIRVKNKPILMLMLFIFMPLIEDSIIFPILRKGNYSNISGVSTLYSIPFLLSTRSTYVI